MQGSGLVHGSCPIAQGRFTPRQGWGSVGSACKCRTYLASISVQCNYRREEVTGMSFPLPRRTGAEESQGCL